MTAPITLYGLGTSRSSRCRWTLLELGVPFDYVEDRALLGSDELRAKQPMAKLPALVVDGQPLFESAAICTYLCDRFGNGNLIGASSTWARAQHDQWVSFGSSELEAYLWSSAKHSSFYPQEKRVEGVIATNAEEIHKALAVLDTHLRGQEFLVDSRFSCADMIVGWSINWARRGGYLEGYSSLSAYVARLFARELCTFNPE
jgi:glutathione S-transferase